ncbi:FxsA family protein [Microbulbifer sp. TRSA002]|uniref:FxsA family protein n=1 Tax=Microbulbifer sp. TRSA002 TaxID=3243382 RepID=UPI00403A5867
MKWFLFLIILGVSEVAVIGWLHSLLGLNTLIGLYVVTTAIGAVFLYVQYPEFKQSKKVSKSIGKKLSKQFEGKGHNLSPEQLEKLRPFLFMVRYGVAFFLIIIPGVISDIVGIVMMLPVVVSFFINRSIDKAIAKVEAQP